jgi:hypothetical protein
VRVVRAEREQPATKRSVTLTGSRPLSLGRFTCGTPARSPFGLRPAPRRLPPQLTKPNSSCGEVLFFMQTTVPGSRDSFGDSRDSSQNPAAAQLERRTPLD